MTLDRRRRRRPSAGSLPVVVGRDAGDRGRAAQSSNPPAICQTGTECRAAGRQLQRLLHGTPVRQDLLGLQVPYGSDLSSRSTDRRLSSLANSQRWVRAPTRGRTPIATMRSSRSGDSSASLLRCPQAIGDRSPPKPCRLAATSQGQTCSDCSCHAARTRDCSRAGRECLKIWHRCH